jgi:hypothetical protein
MLAVILCLCGKKVDIVTSSKVLAIRDSKFYEESTLEGCASFYQIFCLNCGNICDSLSEDEITGEKHRYDVY